MWAGRVESIIVNGIRNLGVCSGRVSLIPDHDHVRQNRVAALDRQLGPLAVTTRSTLIDWRSGPRTMWPNRGSVASTLLMVTSSPLQLCPSADSLRARYSMPSASCHLVATFCDTVTLDYNPIPSEGDLHNAFRWFAARLPAGH